MFLKTTYTTMPFGISAINVSRKLGAWKYQNKNQTAKRNKPPSRSEYCQAGKAASVKLATIKGFGGRGEELRSYYSNSYCYPQALLKSEARFGNRSSGQLWKRDNALRQKGKRGSGAGLHWDPIEEKRREEKRREEKRREEKRREEKRRDEKRREEKRREEKRREEKRREEKRTEQKRREQNRREQNRTEQNRTELNRT